MRNGILDEPHGSLILWPNGYLCQNAEVVSGPVVSGRFVEDHIRRHDSSITAPVTPGAHEDGVDATVVIRKSPHEFRRFPCVVVSGGAGVAAIMVSGSFPGVEVAQGSV